MAAHQDLEKPVGIWPVPAVPQMQPVLVMDASATHGFDLVVDPSLMHFGWQPMQWQEGQCQEAAHAAAGCAFALDCEESSMHEQSCLEHSYLSASASRRRRRQKAKAAHRQQPEHDEETRKVMLDADVAAASKELMKWLESEEKASVDAALERLQGSILDFGFHPAGCRVVQKALEMGSGTMAGQLAQELRGHVRRAIASPHCNYVVQKVVEQLPTTVAGFIVDELQGAGAQATRHPFGCRVMCRLIEHSLNNKKTVALFEEVLQQAPDLCRHPYGHHVMEHILEHGLQSQKSIIVQALLQDMHRNARHRQATYVIEKALENGTALEVQQMEMVLFAEPGNVLELAENQFGCHIVMTLMRQPSESAKIAQHIVRTGAERLRADKFGSKVLEELAC
eukprot:TRINITY_DN82406_c0_g1_i1.p1 TRINITY_DN82406_c0_g1~~TRINITY_DN82406_c0_g1_i1.p1  ORF type:complete len:451 (+),score=105.51 TRINITY_DN82406_c0_g1_i1:171-1355(+)